MRACIRARVRVRVLMCARARMCGISGCEDGFFGQFCNNTCSKACTRVINGSACDDISGSCHNGRFLSGLHEVPAIHRVLGTRLLRLLLPL